MDATEKTVGIIGMGDMGAMYAKKLSDAGWRINACDAPHKFDKLKEAYAGNVGRVYPRPAERLAEAMI
ncbi:hypothetical protein BKA80DRAFT_270150, partial [Phyllosticta citrichinensis]